MSSCIVPLKKYKILQSKYADSFKRDSLCQEDKRKTENKLIDSQAEVDRLSTLVRQLQKDTAQQRQYTQHLEAQMDEIAEKQSKLQNNYNQLYKNSSQEAGNNSKLKKDLTDAQKYIEQLEEELLDKTDDIKFLQKKISEISSRTKNDEEE
jgi:methyl-accepting chemotaxis protein